MVRKCVVQKWRKLVEKLWNSSYPDFFSKISILMKIQHFDDSSHLINRDRDSWCIRVKPPLTKTGMVWYNHKTEYRGPPREVLSEFDSSISGLSIMKAREFENSKIEGWKSQISEINSKTLRILRTSPILKLPKVLNYKFFHHGNFYFNDYVIMTSLTLIYIVVVIDIVVRLRPVTLRSSYRKSVIWYVS